MSRYVLPAPSHQLPKDMGPLSHLFESNLSMWLIYGSFHSTTQEICGTVTWLVSVSLLQDSKFKPHINQLSFCKGRL